MKKLWNYCSLSYIISFQVWWVWIVLTSHQTWLQCVWVICSYTAGLLWIVFVCFVLETASREVARRSVLVIFGCVAVAIAILTSPYTLLGSTIIAIALHFIIRNLDENPVIRDIAST